MTAQEALTITMNTLAEKNTLALGPILFGIKQAANAGKREYNHAQSINETTRKALKDLGYMVGKDNFSQREGSNISIKW